MLPAAPTKANASGLEEDWMTARVIDAGTFDLLAPLTPVEIGWNNAVHQYRKCIGKKSDGKPRIFWLGRDEADARFTASVLSWCHDLLRGQGNNHWTPATEQWAMQQVQARKDYAQGYALMLQRQINQLAGSGAPVAMPAPAPVAARGSIAAPRPGQLTLGEAARRHVEFLKSRQIGKKYTERAATSYKQMFEVLPEATPLSAIGKPELVKLTGHFLARPVRAKTGRPLSVDSVRTLFADVKRLLDAMDGEGWDGSRGWQKLFRHRWNGLLTPAEQKRQADGKEVFDLEELKTLYELAGDRVKLYTLLALNCGFTQGEISSLLTDDVDLEAGTIVKIRHKTRATAATRGEWVLWPQTRRLLAKFMAETPANADGLALMTIDQRPLVDDRSNTDSIALRWGRLLDAAEQAGKTIRRLSFGHLRKTASTFILNLSGSESVQQMMLCHAPRSIAGRHYTGRKDVQPLHQALEKFRRVLLEAKVLPAEAQPEAA